MGLPRLAAAVIAGVLLATAVRGAAEDAPAGGPAAPPAEKQVPAPPRRAAGDEVSHLAVSGNGRRIVAATFRTQVVWDVDSAKPIHEWKTKGHFGPPSLDPAGGLVVSPLRGDTYGVSAVQVRSLAPDGPPMREFCRRAASPGFYYKDDTGQVDWGAYVPSLRAVVLLYVKAGIAVHDPRTLELLSEVTSDDLAQRLEYANRLAFSSDGKLVAWSHAAEVVVSDWPSAKERWTASASDGSIGPQPSFAADDQVVLAPAIRAIKNSKQFDLTLTAFDTATGKELWTRAKVKLLAVGAQGPGSADAFLSQANGFYVIDVATGSPRHRVADSGNQITAAAFTPDGRFLWCAKGSRGDIVRFEIPPRETK